MDWGLIVTLKRWMGEAWKRRLAGGFTGPSGRVLDNFFFFFSNASLDARIAMVGSDHPFAERMGRLGRKGVFWAITWASGLGKRLAYVRRLKMGKFSVEKTGKIGAVDFKRLISNDRGSDRRSAGADGKGRGETYWRRMRALNHTNSVIKREKGVQHEDFPEVTHPGATRPSTA